MENNINNQTNQVDNQLKQENEYYYIYNLEQANFYINNKLQVVGVGKGMKGDLFCKFIINDDSKEVFSKWCDLCRLLKA